MSNTYIFPGLFLKETTWDGHATLVAEIEQQLRDLEAEDFSVPSAVVTCAGGGGLATGIEVIRFN